jgi:CHAT domain-containing protein
VREFRRYLEKRTSREYLPPAQQLYGWLIRPLQAQLDAQQIETLVIVPDGPLRTIPTGALHDGQNFLIRHYAIATTPGLTLTDLRPIPRQKIQPLLNGLTEARQGFPALDYVQKELAAIHAVYGGKVLENENYRLANMQQELKETPYSIVHIASHGQFASDVRNTFLLTFDDKLTMDRLERFMSLSQYRDQPVELLTLSACQTAAGDDRAALGLAGVASQGRRSQCFGNLVVHQRSSVVAAGNGVLPAVARPESIQGQGVATGATAIIVGSPLSASRLLVAVSADRELAVNYFTALDRRAAQSHCLDLDRRENRC